MKTFISLADVDSIKAELTRLLPGVKSSHRVEAMARGLGWNTNAALRTGLAESAAERAVDNHAFIDYLTEHGFIDLPYDTLVEAIVRSKFATARADIEAVMAQAPQLTHFGFGVFDAHERTPEQRKAELAKGRQEMLTAGAVYEFTLAREFLARRGKRATINNSSSSYGLKHQAEHTCGEYISNGMLIAAAIHLGFKIKRDGPNAYLNIASERTGASSGSRTRPTAVDAVVVRL